MNLPSSPAVHELIELALREDLSEGDITTQLSVPENVFASAILLAREPLCVCGVPLIDHIAKAYKCQLEVEVFCEEGREVESETNIAQVKGKLRDLLALERTLLNFIQHLSGVATYTKKVMREANTLTVLDTRKTLPGYRELEKYAVRVGGAKNHRMHLGDMILVKNNHVDARGGDMRATLEAIASTKPQNMRWEVEVRDMKELQIALEFAPDMIMLDNMDDQMVCDAMVLVGNAANRPFIEVSGNITPARFSKLEQAGVDGVSMGALTSRAQSVDISFRIKKES